MCVQGGVLGLLAKIGSCLDCVIDRLTGRTVIIKELIHTMLPLLAYILTGCVIGLMEGWNFRESCYWAAMTGKWVAAQSARASLRS